MQSVYRKSAAKHISLTRSQHSQESHDSSRQCFLCLATLTSWPQNKRVFQDSWWNISMSSLVILDASGFEISCGKTDRQTNKHINAAETPPMRLLSEWIISHILKMILKFFCHSTTNGKNINYTILLFTTGQFCTHILHKFKIKFLVHFSKTIHFSEATTRELCSIRSKCR